MLDHPSCGPNATINRWIEDIRKYHFELVHIKGTKHGSDGLSRITPGGYQPPRPPINPDDYDDNDDGEPITFLINDEDLGDILEFDSFRNDIDPRSGYSLSDPAKSVGDLEDDIEQALEEDRFYRY